MATYCDIDEAWGIPKRKRNKHQARYETFSETPNEGCHAQNQNNRQFTRDINTQKEHNGPNERFHMNDLQLSGQEGFQGGQSSSQQPVQMAMQMQGGAQGSLPSYQSPFQNDELQQYGQQSYQDNDQQHEMMWMREQLRIISEKLSMLMNTNTQGGGAGGSSNCPQSHQSVMGDVVLYLSTGILTIFMLDLFLKKTI